MNLIENINKDERDLFEREMVRERRFLAELRTSINIAGYDAELGIEDKELAELLLRSLHLMRSTVIAHRIERYYEHEQTTDSED